MSLRECPRKAAKQNAVTAKKQEMKIEKEMQDSFTRTKSAKKRVNRAVTVESSQRVSEAPRGGAGLKSLPS